MGDEIVVGGNMDPSIHYGALFRIHTILTRMAGGTHFPILLKSYIPPGAFN